MKPKILVIVGTTREGRRGRKIADWYIEEARKATGELEFEMYDLADLKLEVFNEPQSPITGPNTDIEKKITEKLKSADGFVFVVGEYDHSLPGSLKNFIDYTFHGWQRKPVAFVGYGTIGAVRSISQLIHIMTYFGAFSIIQMLNIIKSRDAFDENGVPKPDHILGGDIPKQMEQLVWWTKTLKQGREQNS